MSEFKRIYQIDLFRFIAATAVVLYHYLYRGYTAGNMSLLSFDGIGEYFKYGYLGVDLFFIISGFVIAFSIKHLSLRKFCYSRFKRLYPMYWICLMLTFIVSYFWGAPRYHVTFTQLLANLTMVQKLWGQGDIDGAYWSLYVELKFYLIIALFLILNRFKKISLDYLVYFWIALPTIKLLLGRSVIYAVIYEFFLLDWSAYFIAGIIFCQIFLNGPHIKYFLLLPLCLYRSINGAVGRIHWLERTFHSDFSPYIIGAAIVVFYLLILLVSCKKLQAINSPRFVKIGMLTYPLYLVHQHIGFIIFNHLQPYLNKYLLLSAVIGLMLAIAYILSDRIEPRIMKLFKS
ncbi:MULTISPECIES: acyltransferase family protein [Sphingobacterium]|uniref:acyltransferase family protein n=1 Tax=Sphingobacterium TaxID=28453 RepID=UPI00257B8BCD|nr:MULTISPECIES: acyltransferase [Sphingobacterium]